MNDSEGRHTETDWSGKVRTEGNPRYNRLAKRTDLTQALLKECLRYNPETGDFTTLTEWYRKPVGQVVGGICGSGYAVVHLFGFRYFSHRLAFLYMTGVWPKKHVDHINGIRTDTRWDNLRDATPAQNGRNRKVCPRNKSGFKGVHWNEKREVWESAIAADGKINYLGRFDTPQEAARAYDNAALELHGAFAKTNEMQGLLPEQSQVKEPSQ